MKKIRINNWKEIFLEYGFAIVVTTLALFVTKLIRPLSDSHFFELFQAAVVLSAWYGGMGPGILSATLAFLLIAYFFLVPVHSFAFNVQEEWRFIVFEGVAILTGSLSGKLKWAKTELETRLLELKKTKDELERAHNQLEARITHRTEELSIANEKLIKEVAQRMEAEHAILEISHREQLRLGQDLHDGLCQILSGVKFMTGSLKDEISEISQPHSNRLASVESRLGDALAYVDTISRGLYPVELEVNGLVAALEELADKTSQVFSVQCRFRCWNHLTFDNRVVANHIYRIAQESVMNAIKGGKATQIHIRLNSDNSRIVLTVADNGIGFGNKPMRKGMGIKLMEHRARVINGTFKIRSRKSGGTVVSCSFQGERTNHVNQIFEQAKIKV